MNNTQYKYFTNYKMDFPKTSMLILQGLNDNNLCVKGFLIKSNTKVYLIDKTNQQLGDKHIVTEMPTTFEKKWHFDNKVKIFYDDGLFKTIIGESINIFNRKDTNEYVIQIGIKKKNRKR